MSSHVCEYELLTVYKIRKWSCRKQINEPVAIYTCSWVLPVHSSFTRMENRTKRQNQTANKNSLTVTTQYMYFTLCPFSLQPNYISINCLKKAGVYSGNAETTQRVFCEALWMFSNVYTEYLKSVQNYDTSMVLSKNACNWPVVLMLIKVSWQKCQIDSLAVWNCICYDNDLSNFGFTRSMSIANQTKQLWMQKCHN